MPGIQIGEQVTLRFANGLACTGYMEATVRYSLLEDGRCIPDEGKVEGVLYEFRFEGPHPDRLINGLAEMESTSGSIRETVPVVLQNDEDALYFGTFYFTSPPYSVFDDTYVEGGARGASNSPTQGLGQLPATFSLLQAKEYVDLARMRIREYIRTETPDDFGLAMLNGLLQEIDNLGAELDGIVSIDALTPRAAKSISVIELIKLWVVAKGSLKDLVEALQWLLDQFS